MSEPAFRGTLLLLQNRTRRDPESYRDEFLAQLDHFKAASAIVAAQRVANPQYIAVLNYLCHVAHCFPRESATVAATVMELLRSSRNNALLPELRTALVKCAMLLRSKELVTLEESFPVFFALLQERDKTLRKLILTHIVGDIRRVNARKHAAHDGQVNRKAQNYLFAVMEEDDAVQARCAEMILIDLYRRRVWCDERTVEVMTRACFSRHTSILRTALRFFLLQMPKITSLQNGPDEEADSEDEVDPGRSVSKLKQKLKIVKKTSKRERVLKRNMREIKRRYDKQQQAEEDFAKQHVDPIRLLRDPQSFVERLFAKLQRTAERFEVRILYLNVLARAITEHELIHLPLYGFLERYMEPSQLHATQLLALSAMCVHRLVPPDVVTPLVRTIANHFVSDRSTADAITIGLNTIREICKRQPLAMTADLLKDLVEYKNQRGEKGVMMAARALVQLYRDVYPELLPAKLRGGGGVTAGDGARQRPVYGAERVYTDIPGLELLYAASQQTQSMDERASEDAVISGTANDGKIRDNTANSGGDDDSSSSSSSSEIVLDDDDDEASDGEWVTDSDSEVASSDIDGDYVNVTDCDDDEDDDDEGDDDGSDEDEACPELVPVAATGRDQGARFSAGEKRDMLANMPRKRHRPEAEDEAEGVNESGEEVDEVEDGGAVETETDDEARSEGEEDGRVATAAKPLKEMAGDWFEDLHDDDDPSPPRAATSRSAASSVTNAKSSQLPISASRVLTDEDFERIRTLQEQCGGHQSLRGKRKERAARTQRRQSLIHGIAADLSAHDIEHFTEKKREEDKQDKIERAQELRKASSKFEIRKKTKSKLNSTHIEHAKRGKLFQMTKRSQRVATKLKSSVADRATRAKEMKKKDIKFRIKRGWKA